MHIYSLSPQGKLRSWMKAVLGRARFEVIKKRKKIKSIYKNMFIDSIREGKLINRTEVFPERNEISGQALHQQTPKSKPSSDGSENLSTYSHLLTASTTKRTTGL